MAPGRRPWAGRRGWRRGRPGLMPGRSSPTDSGPTRRDCHRREKSALRRGPGRLDWLRRGGVGQRGRAKVLLVRHKGLDETRRTAKLSLAGVVVRKLVHLIAQQSARLVFGCVSVIQKKSQRTVTERQSGRRAELQLDRVGSGPCLCSRTDQRRLIGGRR